MCFRDSQKQYFNLIWGTYDTLDTHEKIYT